MTVRNRPALVTLVAALAFALLATGGAAVATSAAKTAAKNSVTSKSIKNGSVVGKDVKDGSVTSADLADGSVGSAELVDGSVGSADLADGSVGTGKVADDGITGADIAEATLGTVPNATKVGGVEVTPLSLSLPSTANGVVVINQAGSTLTLDCEGVGGRFVVGRAASGAPLLVTGIYGTGTATGASLAPSETLEVQVGDSQYTVAVVVPAGGSVTAAFTLIHEVNASGPNDCFFRGTITRIP